MSPRVLVADRVRLATRAAWFGVAGVVALFVALVAASQIQWSTMWLADRVTLLAIALVLTLLGGMALLLLVAALRWLLVAVWPGPVRAEFSAERIVLRPGPGGMREWALSKIQRQEFAVPDDMPIDADEPPLPSLRHPEVSGDLLELLGRQLGRDPRDVFAALAPDLQDALPPQGRGEHD